MHTVEADFVRIVAPDGTVTLHGQDNDGTPFRYTVKDGVVRGWVGNRPVKFPLSEAKAERSGPIDDWQARRTRAPGLFAPRRAT